jgi:hypothetical protein
MPKETRKKTAQMRALLKKTGRKHPEGRQKDIALGRKYTENAGNLKVVSSGRENTAE